MGIFLLLQGVGRDVLMHFVPATYSRRIKKVIGDAPDPSCPPMIHPSSSKGLDPAAFMRHNRMPFHLIRQRISGSPIADKHGNSAFLGLPDSLNPLNLKQLLLGLRGDDALALIRLGRMVLSRNLFSSQLLKFCLF